MYIICQGKNFPIYMKNTLQGILERSLVYGPPCALAHMYHML